MKIIGYDELRPAKGIRYSPQWIRVMVKEGKFPKPIKVGERATGFIEAEIDAWLSARAAERTSGEAA
jgi:prophage regulatory protein